MEILIFYFTAATLLALAMYWVRNKVANYLLYVPFVALQFFYTGYQAVHLDELEGEYFKVDALGLIFITVISILAFITPYHNYKYLENRSDEPQRRSIYNATFIYLITMMTGALSANHLALMWAFIEATTLCTGVLIYHNRSTQALEATWKYVFVCSIGIAIAFIGILLLGIASQDAKELNLSIDRLTANAAVFEPTWLKMSFLFVLTGFSVKMGIVPLFMVDIDAKDAAPSPIGAILSGGLLNVGFVAIFRFYQIFNHTSIHDWLSKVLIINGLLCLAFAAIYLLRVKNYKRMLAYSSVEHAGIALLAVAAGGWGFAAAILHLILHAFTKASLFYQIGQVKRLYRGLPVSDIQGYFRLNPWGGTVLIIGLMSLVAMPPSGLFVTEFFTFGALLKSQPLAVTLTAIVLLTFVIYALGRNFFRLLFAPTPAHLLTDGSAGKVSPAESFSQLVLLGAVMVLGLYPPTVLTELIAKAVVGLR